MGERLRAVPCASLVEHQGCPAVRAPASGACRCGAGCGSPRTDSWVLGPSAQHCSGYQSTQSPRTYTASSLSCMTNRVGCSHRQMTLSGLYISCLFTVGCYRHWKHCGMESSHISHVRVHWCWANDTSYHETALTGKQANLLKAFTWVRHIEHGHLIAAYSHIPSA